MKKGIIWDISNGKHVIIGMDPFVGDKEILYMPKEIVDNIKWISMSTLDKLKRPEWLVLKGGYGLM